MEKQQYNTSKKPIVNTATKEAGPNPLDIRLKSTPSVSVPVARDNRYVGGLPSALGIDDTTNIEAANQPTGKKIGNTLLRGIGKGVSGFVDTTGNVANFLGFLSDQGDEFIDNASEDFDNWLTNSLPVHEPHIDESKEGFDGWWEKTARYSTGESVLSSATEFGLTGVGVGALTKGVGVLALNLGGTMRGMKLADKATTTVGNYLTKTGRVLETNAPIIGKIRSTALTNAAIMNTVEGGVMAEETGKELEDLYAPVLHNPDVPESEKVKIRAEIQAAKTKVKLFNIGLIFSNLIGFSVLTPFTKGGNKVGLRKWLKAIGIAVAPAEGIEELIQNIVQTDSKVGAITSIEEGIDAPKEGMESGPIPGLEYNEEVGVGDQSFLWHVNPQEAEQYTGLTNRRGVDHILNLATQEEAWVEFAAGMLGGGPQWAITGAPSYISSRGERKNREDNLKAYTGVFEKDYNKLIGDKILSNAATNYSILAMKKAYDGTPNEIISEATENFATRKLGIDAVRDRYGDRFIELLDQSESEARASFQEGEIEPTELESTLNRITKAKESYNEFKDATNYYNKDELYNLEVRKIAIEESIAVMQEATSSNETDNAANIELKEKLEVKLKDVNKKIREAKSLESQAIAYEAIKADRVWGKLKYKIESTNSAAKMQSIIQDLTRKEKDKNTDPAELPKIRQFLDTALKKLEVISKRKARTSQANETRTDKKKRADAPEKGKVEPGGVEFVPDADRVPSPDVSNVARKADLDNVGDQLNFTPEQLKGARVRKKNSRDQQNVDNAKNTTKNTKDDIDKGKDIGRTLEDLGENLNQSRTKPVITEKEENDLKLQRFEAQKAVFEYLQGISGMGDTRGYLPSFDQAINSIEASGVKMSETRLAALKHVYSFINDEDIAPNHSGRTQKTTQEEHGEAFSYTETKDDLIDHENQLSINALNISEQTIAWDYDNENKAIYDWNLVKEGAEILVQPSSVPEVQSLIDEFKIELLLNDQAVPAADFFEARDDNEQEFIDQWPMNVTIGNELKQKIQVGYLHVPNWYKNRVDAPAEKIEEKIQENKALRRLAWDSYLEKGGLRMKIDTRRSNIGVNPDTNNISGLALRTIGLGEEKQEALETYGNSPEVIITTLMSSSRSKYNLPPYIERKLTRGETVYNAVVPKWLNPKTSLHKYNGSPVALIPVEGTTKYHVERLLTKKLDGQDFEALSDIITRLHDRNILAKLAQAVDPQHRSLAPNLIKKMVKSLVHLESFNKAEERESSSLMFDIEFKDSTNDEDIPDIYERYNKAVKEESLGSITFHVQAPNGDKNSITYDYMLIPNTGSKNAEIKYKLRGGPGNSEALNLVGKILEGAATDENRDLVPHYNIRNYALEREINNQGSGFFTTDSDGGWNYKFVTDAKNIALSRTMTKVLPPIKLPDGSSQFFTSTLIGVKPIVTEDSKTDASNNIEDRNDNPADISKYPPLSRDQQRAVDKKIREKALRDKGLEGLLKTQTEDEWAAAYYGNMEAQGKGHINKIVEVREEPHLPTEKYGAITHTVNKFGLKRIPGTRSDKAQDFKLLTDILSGANTQELKDSFDGIFRQLVSLGLDINLTPAWVSIYKDEAVAELRGHLKARLSLMPEYRKYLKNTSGFTTKDRKYRVTMQYHQALKLLDAAFNNEGDKANIAYVDKMLSETIAYSLKDLGYKNTENLFRTGERNQYSNRHRELERNIKEKISVKLKAKLSVLPKYFVTEDNVAHPSSSMIGAPVYDKQAYIKVLGFTANASEYNIKFKEKQIHKRALAAMSNPSLYQNKYWITDLSKMLEGTHDYNNFDQRDKAMFNTAMNNVLTNNRSIELTGKSNRIQVKDPNYYNLYTTTIKDMFESFKTLSDNEQTKQVVSAILRGADDSMKLFINPKGSLAAAQDSILFANKNLKRLPSSSIQELLNYREAYYKVKDQEALVEAGGATVMDHISKHLAKRMQDLMIALDGPVNSSYMVTYDALRHHTEASEVDFMGNPTYEVKPVAKFIQDFVYITTNALYSRTIAGNEKQNQIILSNSAKSYIKAMTDASDTHFTELSYRHAGKILATYGNPNSINEIVNRLHSKPKYLDKYNNDAYRKNSIIKRMIQDRHLYQEMGVSQMFSEVARGDVGGTWISSRDEADGDSAHALWDLAYYMHSTNEVHNDGVSYQSGKMTFNQGTRSKEYEFFGRPAMFRVPTISNKDATMAINSLDINSVYVNENGSIGLREEMVKFYVDAVVTPEINRIIKQGNYLGTKYKDEFGETQRLLPNVDYGGHLIYSIPGLNTPEVMDMIDRLPPKGSINTLYAENPFRNKQDNDNYTDLGELVLKAVTETIHKNTRDYIDTLVKANLLTRDGHGRLSAGWFLKDVADFKKFEITGIKRRDKIIPVNQILNKSDDIIRVAPKKGTYDTTEIYKFLLQKEFGQGIMMANYHQLIGGDIAETYKVNTRSNTIQQAIKKTYQNYKKRSAKDIAPAVKGSDEANFIVVGLAEPNKDSSHYGNKVKDIDYMDGIMYSDADTYINNLITDGIVYEEDRKKLKDYYSGKISSKDIPDSWVIGLRKPLVSGETSIHVKDGEVLNNKVYIKTAQSTVTDSKVGRSTTSEYYKINKILKQLRRDKGMDVFLATESAMKLHKPSKLLDLNNLEIDSETGDYIISDDHMFTMSYESYGTQLEEKFKRDKQGKRSGQAEDIMKLAIKYKVTIKTGKNKKKEELAADYLDKINGKIQQLKIANLQELLYQEDVDATVDKQLRPHRNSELAQALIDKGLAEEVDQEVINQVILTPTDANLRAFIISTLKSFNDYNVEATRPYLFKWLEVDQNGKFKHNISNSPNAKKYFDTMKAAVQKQTTAIPFKRRSYPLEPDGYHLLDNAKRKGDEQGLILFDWMLDGDNIAKDGKLKPQLGDKAAQILVPFELRDADGRDLTLADITTTKEVDGVEYTVIDSEKLPPEILESFAYRTPTQNINMTAAVQVVGFLPTAIKHTVVAPSEFVALWGHDFDIDTLYMYHSYYTLNKKRDGYRLLTRDEGMLGLQNEVIRTLATILKHPKVLKEKVIQTLDEPKAFERFANLIERNGLVETNSLHNGETSYSSTALQQQYRNATKDSDLGISISAKLARVYAVLQTNPIIPMIPVYGKPNAEYVPADLQLGDIKVTHFAGSRSKKFGVTTGKINGISKRLFDLVENNISAFISMAVDDENLEGLLGRMGINSDTMPTISHMLMSGFNLQTAVVVANFAPVLNRDSIKEMSNAYARREGESGYLEAHLIKPKDFSYFMKDGKAVINEEEAILGSDGEGLLKFVLNFNKAYYSGNSLQVDMGSAQNGLRLLKFVKYLANSYKHTVTDYSFLFNTDSRGFGDDIGDVIGRQMALESTAAAPVIKHFEKIPTLAHTLESYKAFFEASNRFLQDTEFTKKVQTVVQQSGIPIYTGFDVNQKLNSLVFAKLRPNFDSLRDRLESLRAGEYRAFYDNNEFLKRLRVRNNDIRFLNDVDLLDVDVINGLESLNVGGFMPKIISGGQTGADRIGLEVAREFGTPTGGLAPKGFKTEIGSDETLKDFGLTESDSSNYLVRTEQNIINSDATVIYGNTKSPGSAKTISFAQKHRKPYLVNPTGAALSSWIRENSIQTLNVAGNRGSKLNELQTAKINKSLRGAFKELSGGDFEVGDINMKLLYKDLVNYALTETTQNYGTSYLTYIDPVHQSDPVIQRHREYIEKRLDSGEVAASIVYKHFVHQKKNWDAIPSRPEDAELRPPIYKDVLGQERIIMFKDDMGLYRQYTGSMYKEELVRSKAGSEVDQILEEDKEGEPFEKGGITYTPLDTNKTLERVLSSRSMQPFKALYKMVFKDPDQIITLRGASNPDTNHFNFKTNVLTIGRNNLLTTRAALVHEGTHAVLDKAINAYPNNLHSMFPGADATGAPIADEMQKIILSMDQARGRAIDTMVDYEQNYIDNYKPGNISVKGQKGVIQTPQLVAAVVGTDSNQIIDTTGKLSTSEILARVLPEGHDITANPHNLRVAFLTALMEDNLLHAPNINGVTSLYMVNPHRKEEGEPDAFFLMPQAQDRMKFYDIIIRFIRTNKEDLGISYEDSIKAIAEKIESMENMDPRDKAFKEYDAQRRLLYGLSNLNEFFASAYEVGTKNTIPNTMLEGFTGLAGGYKPIVDNNLTESLKESYRKSYGETIGNIFIDMVRLIKRLVRAMVGKNNANKILKDVMYAKVLVKNSMFVTTEEGKDRITVNYTKDGNELLNRCK